MSIQQASFQRDDKLDILKCIAFLCIILAHTNPPDIVFRLRNFDVTMMVLLCGSSFYLSSLRKPVSYKSYLVKRIHRLILPTWIFLVLFFLLFYTLTRLTHLDYPFTAAKTAASFLLVDGIGYVWIMRIYFLCAVVSPAVLWISRHISSTARYFAFLLVVYVCYLGLNTICSQLSGNVYQLLRNTVIDALGWGVICAVGIRLMQMSRKELAGYALVFSVIHILLMCHYDFATTQNWKYPPRLYYTSYGIAVSLWLYCALQSRAAHRLQHLHPIRYIRIISEHSSQMYFWHIIGIYLLRLYGSAVPVLRNSSALKFCFLFTFALIGAALQERILKSVKEHFTHFPACKINSKERI